MTGNCCDKAIIGGGGLKILAIVVLILVGLYVIIASIKQRKLVLSKSVFVIGGICAVVIVISGAFASNNPPTLAPEYQQAQVPPVKAAPYMLPTISRDYYVMASYEDGQYLWLTAYYEYNRKKWEYRDVPLPFDRELPEYSNLKLIKRGG